MGLFSRRATKEPAAAPEQPQQPQTEQSPPSTSELKQDLPQPSFGPPTLDIPGLGTDAGGGLQLPSMSGGGGKLYDPYEGGCER